MKPLHRLLLLSATLLATSVAPGCGTDDNNASPDNGPSGDGSAEKPIHTVTVAQDGTGDYTTLQAAIDALPVDGQPHIVRLRPGTYKEKVTLTARHPHVTLIGDDAQRCIITYDDYAGRDNGRGGTLGTWQSQTLLIEADDFTARGVTIANSYVNSKVNAAVNKDTQAVALRVEGDRVALYECRVTGYQDTLFGRGTGRIYLRDCHVEGNVDFIFGSSTLVLDRCTLHMNRNNSVITAPSTPPDHHYGIVCMDCTITFPSSDEVDFDGSKFSYFYLGRPWQNAPRAVFLRCEEPAALRAEGWTTMSAAPALFAEYRCTGGGASDDRLAQRANGGRQLTDREAAEYTLERIFARSAAPENGADWLPAAVFTDPDHP